MFSKSFESFKSFIFSFSVFPLDLNFPFTLCGKTPKCPITGILLFIKCL
ncbi:uncharacterized protein METZ01_LOCUS335369, partial [marine metagenome]